MANLNVAVLGASGIGAFHVREFLRAGSSVNAILGSTQATAEKTAHHLEAEYGIHPRAYSDLATLLHSERFDAVSIATPPELHYKQIRACLDAGTHVLSEKPFVLTSMTRNSEPARELIELAGAKDRMVSVNTQWPSVLRFIKPFVDTSHVTSFSMYSQPEAKGVGLLWDHLPHANSILVKLIPGGTTENITLHVSSDEEIDVHFLYRNQESVCAVHFKFKFKRDRPRDITFAINNVEFKRSIGENYRQKLITGNTEIDIEDPFKASLGMFANAIRGNGSPLVGPDEILENVQLQDEIIEEYERAYGTK